jgi:heterotetrameric sarcosine oxidase gamma subunit
MSQTSLPTRKTSALQQAGIEPGQLEASDICICELRQAGLLRLHSLLAPEQIQKALAGCGINLPLQGNESAGHEPLALCLRPGEWLLVSEINQTHELLHRLKPVLELEEQSAGQWVRTALLDYSDGHAVFRLSGKAAPWLLSKISSVDFLAAAAKGQHALRTRMGQIAVVVSYHPASDAGSEFVFDLIFDRSVAAYLWQLLVTSVPHAQELAAEFGEFGLTGSGFSRE